MSTAELYQEPSPPFSADLSDQANHFGPYAKQRQRLDYSYHYLPNKSRQTLQDSIVHVALTVPSKCKTCSDNDISKPTVIFTAGGMGAGKSHAVKVLLDQGQLSLPSSFIWVDPDRLARKFPERPQYLKHNPQATSSLLHPEASLLQEILSNYASDHKRSLVIDGSLADCKWFSEVIKRYKEQEYNVEILFVFADEETMNARAQKRAEETGRHTDIESIRKSKSETPKSVQTLGQVSKGVSRVRLVDNSRDDQDPKIVYDSKDDRDWHNGAPIDIWKFVKR